MKLPHPFFEAGRARTLHYYLVGGAIILFLCLPKFLSIYGMTLLTEIFIYSIFAMSLNLLIGYTGYLSLGHAAFFGIGGYSVAILMTKLGVQNFFFCLSATLIIASIFCFGLGFVAMRVSGIYFLMLTLAIGQMFWASVWSWRSLTGGDDGLTGISRPVFTLFGHRLSLSNEMNFYYFIFAVFLICLFLLYRVVNSPFGRSLRGIRNNEMRMRSLGFNTWRYKYVCYVIAGLFGSIAGALKVYQDCFISTAYASITLSGLALLIVIIGGSQIFIGPVIGTFIIQIIANIVSSYTEYWSTILGATLIFSVMFFPQGVTGYLVNKYRLYSGSNESG